MTQEHNTPQDFEELDVAEEEYEEISGEEVDRVVEELERLITTVESENIQVYLEIALTEVYDLMHGDEEEEEEEEKEVNESSDTAEAA